MCSYSAGIREVSRKEGRVNGILRTINKIMIKHSMTFEEAADFIDIPVEEYPQYKKLLENS